MRARDNPFATARVHRIRYRFEGLNWENFLKRLDEHNYRGAIVGPEGSGKTTLLEDLHPRLIQRGFSVVSLQLTEEEPRFSRAVQRHLCAAVTPATIIMLDGAEQLRRRRWWQFRWLTRNAGGLIITAHRAGRLQTLLRCNTDPDLLENIVRQLLVDRSAIPRSEVERLFQEHRGNIREALRKLYDWHALESDALPSGRETL